MLFWNKDATSLFKNRVIICLKQYLKHAVLILYLGVLLSKNLNNSCRTQVSGHEICKHFNRSLKQKCTS